MIRAAAKFLARRGKTQRATKSASDGFGPSFFLAARSVGRWLMAGAVLF
jgi:hypothetical protein